MARTKYNNLIKKHLHQISGAMVVEVGATDPEGDCTAPDGYPYITLQTRKGEIFSVVFNRDEEGNGAGFPHIQAGYLT